MQLGISTYTYPWATGIPGFMPDIPLTVPDLIRRAQQKGISLLQIGDNLPLHALAPSQLADVVALAGQSGVSLEAGARGLTPENLHTYLRIARQCGSSFLQFVIDAPGYEPAVEEIIRTIRDSLEEIRRSGVRLAIENHDRLPARVLRKIIQSTDTDWVGICLDTANSLGAGEDVDSVSDILAPFTFNLHIKDFAVHRAEHKMGFVIEGRPAGQGLISVSRLLQKMIPYNRCYSSTLELWTPPEATVEETISKEARWADQSIEYLQPFFVKHFPADVSHTVRS